MVAKALDDRVGCAIIVECLRRLASREGLAYVICAAFTAHGALAGLLAPPAVTRFVQAAADRRGIKWQPEVLERGSTDAAAIHLVGPGRTHGGDFRAHPVQPHPS